METKDEIKRSKHKVRDRHWKDLHRTHSSVESTSTKELTAPYRTRQEAQKKKKRKKRKKKINKLKKKKKKKKKKSASRSRKKF